MLNRYTILAFILIPCLAFRNFEDNLPQLYITALKDHISRIEKSIISQSEKEKFNSQPIFIINEHLVPMPGNMGKHQIQELGDSAHVFAREKNSFLAIKLNLLRHTAEVV